MALASSSGRPTVTMLVPSAAVLLCSACSQRERERHLGDQGDHLTSSRSIGRVTWSGRMMTPSSSSQATA